MSGWDIVWTPAKDRYRRNLQPVAQLFRWKTSRFEVPTPSLSQEQGKPATSPKGALQRLNVRSCSYDCGTPGLLKDRDDQMTTGVQRVLDSNQINDHSF